MCPVCAHSSYSYTYIQVVFYKAWIENIDAKKDMCYNEIEVCAQNVLI